MAFARPPDNDARKPSEQKQSSAKTVDCLAGIPAEQIRMEITHPIVECGVLLAIDQYLCAVRVDKDLVYDLVFRLLFKTIGLHRSLPWIDPMEAKTRIALFDVALQGLQRHALLTSSGVDREHQRVAQLRQEDGQSAGESHHRQIKSGADAGPRMYPQHPETRWRSARLEPQFAKRGKHGASPCDL